MVAGKTTLLLQQQHMYGKVSGYTRKAVRSAYSSNSSDTSCVVTGPMFRLHECIVFQHDLQFPHGFVMLPCITTPSPVAAIPTVHNTIYYFHLTP